MSNGPEPRAQRPEANSAFLLHPSSFLLFLATALAVFSPSLFNHYAYDSNIYLQRLGENPAATPAILFGAPADYSSITGVMSWRPVTLFQFMILDMGIFEKNPFLSHLLDIIIHAANTWLFFKILIYLKPQSQPPALFAALLFLVHPLTSEVVLCMGFRFDSLAVFFGLLATVISMQALPRYDSENGGFSGSAGEAPVLPRKSSSFFLHPSSFLLLPFCSAFCLLLALGSKESGIFALFLIPAIQLIESKKRPDANKSPFPTPYSLFPLLLAAALFAIAWKHFQYAHYPAEFMGGGGRLLGMGNFAVVFWTIYFPRLFFPWTLRIDHEFIPATEFNSHVIFASAALLALIAATAWFARRDPWAQIGLLLVLVGFAPVSQLIAIPDPVAERFCYMPMLGFAALAGGLWALGTGLWASRRSATSFESQQLRQGKQPTASTKVPEPRAQRPEPKSTVRCPLSVAVLLLLPSSFILAFSLRSHLRAYDWADDTTLNIRNWESFSPPRSDHTLESLGALYLTRAGEMSQQKGTPIGESADYSRARAALDELLARHPDQAAANRLLAAWYWAGGDKTAALKQTNRALEITPDDPQLLRLRDAAKAPAP